MTRKAGRAPGAFSGLFLLLAMMAVSACRNENCPSCDVVRGEYDAAEFELKKCRADYREESLRQQKTKADLNARNLEAMNLDLAVARRLTGKARLSFAEACQALPSPAIEVMSGRDELKDRADGGGGWWWNEKKQRLEINALK
jgi:hypothetical protein